MTITLDEAIFLSEIDIENSSPTLKQEFKDARQMGLEALKAWKKSRKAGGVMQGFLLPGETEVEKEVVEECSSENPCCDRRGEYNGFSSGPLLFVCPNHCSCHD